MSQLISRLRSIKPGGMVEGLAAQERIHRHLSYINCIVSVANYLSHLPEHLNRYDPRSMLLGAGQQPLAINCRLPVYSTYAHRPFGPQLEDRKGDVSGASRAHKHQPQSRGVGLST